MVCLDTSFIIDVIRGREDVKDLEKELDESSEAITVASPSIMELINGAFLSNKPETEKQKVLSFLSTLIVMPLDKESAILGGEIEAELMKKGEIIEPEDIMIGAIVKQNNETLLTRNEKHFEKINGLKIRSY